MTDVPFTTPYPTRTFSVPHMMRNSFIRLAFQAKNEPESPYWLLNAFIEGHLESMPFTTMVEIAKDLPNGQLHLPCTAESASGKNIMQAWQDVLREFPDETERVREFRWGFFDPKEVTETLAIPKETDDPCMAKLVPLTIIVAEHERQTA
jgi:hypothetical protein